MEILFYIAVAVITFFVSLFMTAYVLERMNHFLFEKPAEMISNYIIEKSSKKEN